MRPNLWQITQQLLVICLLLRPHLGLLLAGVGNFGGYDPVLGTLLGAVPLLYIIRAACSYAAAYPFYITTPRLPIHLDIVNGLRDLLSLKLVLVLGLQLSLQFLLHRILGLGGFLGWLRGSAQSLRFLGLILQGAGKLADFFGGFMGLPFFLADVNQLVRVQGIELNLVLEFRLERFF